MDSIFTFFRINPSILNNDVKKIIVSFAFDSIFLDSIDLPVNHRRHPNGTRWIACKNRDVFALYTHNLLQSRFIGYIDIDLMLVQTNLKQWYNLYGWPVFSINGVIYDKRYTEKTMKYEKSTINMISYVSNHIQ